MKKSEATAVGGVPQNAGKSIKMQKEEKTTISDVLSAVNKLSVDMDQKFVSQKDDILTQMDDKIIDVLSAVDKLSVDIDQKLEDQKNEILDVVLKTAELDEQRFQKIESSLNGIETRLSRVESTINTQVVKKTDLEDAFAKFSLDANSQHKRVDKLTNILHKKKILTVTETQVVLAN